MIYKIYKLLLNHYGYQNWWPAESRYEVVVGVILTQNTSWKNVEKAIKNLKAKNLLDEEKILNISMNELKELIKPAGFYNIKSERLKEITSFIVNNYGSTENMYLSKEPMKVLREKLLNVKGIGKESADSILLYALDRPSFVVDTYTKRLFNRLGILNSEDYEYIKRIFEENIPKDLKVYKEYHALIVEHCKTVCKKKPKCNKCFLKDICLFRF
ncbi:endonuclease III [Methanocaldococcus villosus KIN24-T80]|uniref:Endonuclease III n=1 Tax=Methanocaldococcus villosus KIN24-T80 TaxID=1069083 RepID=N6VPP5_9EURY|nr:endonuclease III domain-containing protein [Methanocaldococcus villosus]ENN95870.1 endonuclease III [Methanocaldococcus villosus KIN24-T80]